MSESLKRDEPPCLVKNSVAEAFPPTFMVRSWASCHESRLVDLVARKRARSVSEKRGRGIEDGMEDCEGAEILRRWKEYVSTRGVDARY